MTAARETFVNGIVELADGAPIANGAAPRRKRLELIWDADMQNRPKPKQTIEGVLLEKSTAMLVGKPGVGKGLVLVDMFYRVAHGMDYHGHATDQGPCVYYALERDGGLGARVRAWKKHHAREGNADVAFLTGHASLFEPAGLAEVLQWLDEITQQAGRPIRLFAVDTLAKALLPGDENSTQDAGAFMENLQRIAATGPTVIGSHHLNAGGTRERGNTAILGDIDTKILVDGTTTAVTLKCDKMNELPKFDDLHLNITRYPEPEIDSAVVQSSMELCGVLLTPEMLELLEALQTAGLGDPAASSKWLKAWGGPESTFYKLRSAVYSRHYVTKGDGARGLYELTLAGKSAVSSKLHKAP